jgi:dTDP-4-dehydrorhamnose 3,5-epimerase
MMNVKYTTLDGVLLIEPPTMFKDFRGGYVETYNEEIYHQANITQKFVQDDIAYSRRDVLRGFHGDKKTWKLITCLSGKFLLVIVNWDDTSPQYMQSESFELSDENYLQVLVPPMHGNAHLVLTDHAIFHYKQTTYYDSESQFTVLWNDPRLKIDWPVTDPILSERDQSGDS